MLNWIRSFGIVSVIVLYVQMSPALAGQGVNILPMSSDLDMPIVPATMAILVNDNDPASLELGQRYASVRGIPIDNIVHLNLPRVKYIARHLFIREYEKLKLDTRYARFKAFTLAFSQPFRVDSNQSITSAFSQGIASVQWVGVCNPTVENPDFGRPAGAPLESKPAMMLTTGGTAADDFALVERGKSADRSDPSGTVYLVKTSDPARSKPRETAMDETYAKLNAEVDISKLTTNNFGSKSDIIGYQTGLAHLPNLATLGFRPGAYADHLTSFGGAIADKRGQTPITALMLAGATASYGTVREPCNFSVKFPDPDRILENYLRGDTLVEAYWKSVAMTTEGLLIGEPLARPFPPFSAHLEGDAVTLTANRHSHAFILAQSQTIGSSNSASKAGYRVGVYDVRLGRPELLGTLNVSGVFKEGDTLGVVKLKNIGEVEVELGVLLQEN